MSNRRACLADGRVHQRVFKEIGRPDELGARGSDGSRAIPAALSHAQIVPDQDVAQDAAANPPAAPLRERVLAWKRRFETTCHALDLAPDLADAIGSRTWFRGLATMLGLSAAALAFWPDFSSLEAATAIPVDRTSRDEFRSQMIMPLALGGDSGRRMAATDAVIPLAQAPERPTIRLTATLGQGDSFGRMLQRAGVGAADAGRVAALAAAQVPLSQIAPGTRFDITLGRRAAPDSPRPLDQLAFRARFDLELDVVRSGGALVARPRGIAVDTTPLRIRGRVGSGLYRSARAAGAPIEAIRQYLRAIDQHISLEGDVGADDQFDLVIGYKRSARGESELGELLYAEIEHGGKPRVQLLRWGKDGQFFEASGMGQQQSARQFAPVAGRLTSQFGMRRHPILGYRRMHGGIDFGARYGSPIHAVSDGRVSWSGRHGGHGNYVRIEHGGGLGSGYAHMSRIAVPAGSAVRAGQVIGYVGSTGLSTGPHLHFEVYQGNRKIDPLTARFTARVQVDKEQLAAFRKRLAELKAVVPGAALASIAPRQAEVKQPTREIERLEP